MRPTPSAAARSRSTGSRAPGRYSPIAMAVTSRSVISSTRVGIVELLGEQPRGRHGGMFGHRCAPPVVDTGMLIPIRLVLQRDHCGYMLSAMLVETRMVPFLDGETWVQITTPRRPATGRPSAVRPARRPGDGARLRAQHRRTRRRDRPRRSSTTTRSAAAAARTCPTRRATSGPRSCSSTNSTPSVPTLGIEQLPRPRPVVGWHARRRDRRAPAAGPGLAVDLQLPGVDGAVDGRRRELLRSELPEDTQRALDRHEAAGTVTDPEYLAATQEFYRRHVCRLTPTPQDFLDSEAQMEAEPTVYHTMNGPNEFHVLGTLQVVDDRRPARTRSPPRRWWSPASSTRPRPPRGHRSSSGSPTRAATSSPAPATAPTWNNPRSSGPSSPHSSPNTIDRNPHGQLRHAASTDGQRSLESFGYTQELNRSVSTVDLLVYGLVFMVPIAPWAIFGTVYNSASGMVPLVYVIGLIAMIFTALAYSQMAKSFPLAGSVFSYVGRGIHPSLGFFAGWAILLDYLLVPTLLYVFAAESMVGLFPGTPRWLWAIVFVVVNTIINLAGISSAEDRQPGLPGHRAGLRRDLRRHRGARDQRTVPAQRRLEHRCRSGTPSTVTAPLIATALSIAVLSFLGFDGISTLAEESTGRKNPAGRAMIIALFVVAFLFVTQTWLASLLAGGRESFSDDEAGNAFFTLVQAASNTGWMNAFFAVNVMAVGFANAMAAQAATSRLLYSMSRDGQLPSFLSKISSRKVPMAAHPRRQRAQPGAGAVLRRPDRLDLVAGQLRRAVRLLPAARLGGLVLRGAPEVEELPAAPGGADPGLPDHRLRAVQRRLAGQDRRPGVAGHRRDRVRDQRVPRQGRAGAAPRRTTTH